MSVRKSESVQERSIVCGGGGLHIWRGVCIWRGYVCVWRLKVSIRCPPQWLPTFEFGWLVHELQGSAYLYQSCAGYRCCC